MKISMNNVGNYNPLLKTKTDLNQKFNLEINHNQKIKPQASERANITQEEKNFFMGLYPDNKNEIVDYHFYQKSGKMSGVKVGSNIDRRG